MIKIGGNDIIDIAVDSTPIEKAYIGSTLVWEKNPGPQPDPYTLYMWLDGTDAPNGNGKWEDKEGGLEWSLVSATHGTDYYEFANPASGVASSYAGISGLGATIDFGKHWKVIADVEIGNTTQNGFLMDLCSYATVQSGKNGLGLSVNSSVGSTATVKIGGNTSTTMNTASGAGIDLSNTWNRVTLRWECVEVSSTQSRINCYIGDTLCRYSNDFNTINWSDFRVTTSPYNNVYIGRGIQNSSKYHAPLRFRLYDLKIYKLNEG